MVRIKRTQSTGWRLEKNVETKWKMEDWQCLILLPLILEPCSYREVAISGWVLEIKEEKEKQKKMERKDSLFRHLHHLTVRRVMNMALLLPGNQWLPLSHAFASHKHHTRDGHFKDPNSTWCSFFIRKLIASFLTAASSSISTSTGQHWGHPLTQGLDRQNSKNTSVTTQVG